MSGIFVPKTSIIRSFFFKL